LGWRELRTKNSFARARVAVVAGEASGHAVVHCLRRMGLAVVHDLSDIEQARLLCSSGRVNACLVVLPRPVPDQVPSLQLETGAPGRGTGIPSLLIADVLTPHLLKTAGRAGYIAAIPADITPRMLYRCIGALLQQSRRVADRSSGRYGELAQPTDPMREAVPRTLAFGSIDPGKLKLQ
jgi:hypothetical protein